MMSLSKNTGGAASMVLWAKTVAGKSTLVNALHGV